MLYKSTTGSALCTYRRVVADVRRHMHPSHRPARTPSPASAMLVPASGRSPASWLPWSLLAGAYSHTMEVGEVLSSDEALVDIGAVEPGPADRAPVRVEAEGP